MSIFHTSATVICTRLLKCYKIEWSKFGQIERIEKTSLCTPQAEKNAGGLTYGHWRVASLQCQLRSAELVFNVESELFIANATGRTNQQHPRYARRAKLYITSSQVGQIGPSAGVVVVPSRRTYSDHGCSQLSTTKFAGRPCWMPSHPLQATDT